MSATFNAAKLALSLGLACALDTRFDKDKAPETGRKSDPKTGGGCDDVKLVAGKPECMSRHGKPGNKGGPY